MRRPSNTLTPGKGLSELGLLRQIRSRTADQAHPALSLGIGDDCALLRVKPGEEIAITTDLSIAGRHFRLDWHPPEAIGHRTLARGLSDLAAMGARPIAAFLSLGLPRELVVKNGRMPSWANRYFDGLLGLAARYKTPLAGGDLAQSTLAAADVVVVGRVPRGKALLRSGARPGDLIYVTGSLGGSAAGLDQLRKTIAKIPNTPYPRRRSTDEALAPHLWPEPRIPQGLWLQSRRAATAGIDISDGLSTDLEHICEESGVSAEIDSVSIPIAKGASLEQALHGGEDYQLLFTARPATSIPSLISRVPIACIGQILKLRAGQPCIVLRTETGRRQPLPRRGWEHFA